MQRNTEGDVWAIVRWTAVLELGRDRPERRLSEARFAEPPHERLRLRLRRGRVGRLGGGERGGRSSRGRLAWDPGHTPTVGAARELRSTSTPHVTVANIRAVLRNVLVVVALLVLATPARSEILPRAQTEQWEQAAREYWRSGNPPCGAVTVIADPAPSELRGGYADDEACVIAIDTQSGITPSQMCALFVHEWGHLLGHPHSTAPTLADPDAVMSPTVGAVRTCPTGETPKSLGFSKRLPHRKRDRAWCRRHRETCARKYPAVYQRALPRQRGAVATARG